jgi:hypothetical protein
LLLDVSCNTQFDRTLAHIHTHTHTHNNIHMSTEPHTHTMSINDLWHVSKRN